ncbi:ADAMTS9 [Symbiodinium natans]|uniref:ADAMTS9 protein n=1 Tax=Symbiodinium natans TaxID=878477 RepID=A0A812LD50_9DINO|nr:ADAMTS9 [Symbiodinium natans]
MFRIATDTDNMSFIEEYGTPPEQQLFQIDETLGNVATAHQGQTVDITRSDVPGGWGQRLSLVCVTPALAGLSDRPQVQATGPESLLLSPRDNQSVTVTYPEKLATTMQGCECATIYLEMAVEGSGDWLRREGVDGLCSDWGSRRCVVDRLAAGQIYEGRVRIQCSDTGLSSSWTLAGATVSTNLEAFTVTGSISVQASGRRLASSGAFRARLRATLSEVAEVEETAVLVEDGVVGGTASLDFVLAASTIGLEFDEAEAENVAEATAQRLTSSLALDFHSKLAQKLGYSVDVEVLQPVTVERQSDAFATCGQPPLVANAAANWTQAACLGRTWSDGPCAVPCDVGFLPEGSGFLCGVDGAWFDVPRCASIWTVGEWGECLGVPGNCGEGGVQRREAGDKKVLIAMTVRCSKRARRTEMSEEASRDADDEMQDLERLGTSSC